MYNILLTLEYDGSGFSGWQTQPEVRTIETELKKALSLVLGENDLRLTSSGRTDAGVHARAQKVNFKVKNKPDLYRLTHAVSSILKGEVSIIDAKFVSLDFNARRDSIKKQYSYYILNRTAPAVLDKGKVWHIAKELDFKLMNNQAEQLVGTYDFTSFRAARCTSTTPVKTILSARVLKEGDYVIFSVQGNAFLKQMVRIIVGTLVEISQGKINKSISEVIDLKNRKEAGVTAPGHGLFLEKVFYSESSLQYN